MEKKIGDNKLIRAELEKKFPNNDTGDINLTCLTRGDAYNYPPTDPEVTHFWLKVNIHIAEKVIPMYLGGYAVPGPIETSIKKGGLGIGGVAPKVDIKKISQYNLKGQKLPAKNLETAPSGITISNHNINNSFQKSIITK